MSLRLKDYKDYKSFLKDFYHQKLESNSGFSFTVWARSIGISSPSTLSMIVNGSRHPGPKLCKKLEQYFDFNEDESEFFKSLILLQKTKSTPHLTIHLKQNSSNNNDTNHVELATFVIRETLNNVSTKAPVDYIRNSLNIEMSDEDIQKRINFLLEKKLLEKENITYKAKSNIYEELLTSKESIYNFHKSTLDNSKKAFNRTKIEERSFNTSILKIKNNDLEKAKELIKEFQHKMTDLLDTEEESDSTHILHISFHPFQ